MNQSKEADTPQTVVQDIEEEVEVGAVADTEEETTVNLKALEKKKVTMIMIKKNLKLKKDQEDHTEAEDEAAEVEEDFVVVEDIVDVPEVMVQEMKTLRMKDVMLKTKAVNQKDEEMVAIYAGPEDSAVDQDDPLHRALETKVIIAIEENRAIIVTEESKKNEVREDLKDVEIAGDVAEDVDGPRDRIVHVSHETRVERKHPKAAHLRNKNLRTKLHHNLLRFKTRPREETYSTSKLLRFVLSHFKYFVVEVISNCYDKRSSMYLERHHIVDLELVCSF